MKIPIRFVDKHLQGTYERFRAHAANTLSDLYANGIPCTTGSATRAAYWSGRRGAPAGPQYKRGSMSYAIWRAGADDLKAAKGEMVKGLMPYVTPRK